MSSAPWLVHQAYRLIAEVSSMQGCGDSSSARIFSACLMRNARRRQLHALFRRQKIKSNADIRKMRCRTMFRQYADIHQAKYPDITAGDQYQYL